MKKFQFNDGCINIPTPWIDESAIVLKPNEPGFENTSFVISHDNQREAEEFNEFCNRQSDQLACSLPEFKLICKSDITLTGQTCKLIEFEWNNPEGMMHQMVVLVPLEDRRILVMTSTQVGKMTQERRKYFASVVQSLELAQRSGA